MSHLGILYEFFSSLVLFFGNGSVFFWQFLLVSVFVFNGFCFLKAYKEKSVNEFLFLIINLLSFVLLRIPSFASNELNADEGEWIAGAATLAVDPRFWLSVDGTTSGPLNIFPLSILPALGIQMGFAEARFFKVFFLDLPLILFIYYGIKKISNSKNAMITVFLFVIFYGALVQKDILAYGSENVPMFLIAALLMLLANMFKKISFFQLLLAGGLVGMLPFSKLQSAYIAFLLGLACLWQVWFYHKATIQSKLIKTSALILGGLMPIIFLLVYLKSNNLSDDFLQSYIFNNISYAANVSLLDAWFMPIMILKKVKLLLFLFVTTFFLIAVSIIFLSKKILEIEKKERATMVFLLFFVLISWYSVGKPGREFEHYLNFIFIPFIALSAYFLYVLEKYTSNIKFTRKFLPIILVSIVSLHVIWTLANGNYLASQVVLKGKVKTNPLCDEIKHFRKSPKDRLVVWGWQITDTGWGSHNKYYIETNLIQGTRESHSERQQTTFENKNAKAEAQYQYYRNRYLQDIRTNKPIFFIDLNASVKTIFPQLQALLDSNFSKVGEFDQFHHDTLPIHSILYVANRRIIR